MVRQSWGMYAAELRRTLSLALPMVLSQVAAHLLQVIDLAMVGRLGVVPLAAATFSVNLWAIFLLFCIGLTSALTIVVGEARGRGDEASARESLRASLLLTLALGIVITGVLLGLLYGTTWWHLGQPPEVLREALPYLALLAATIVPLLPFFSLRGYAEAMGRPWLALYFLIFAIVLNVILNWLFIYGNLGFPRWELIGAGVATLLARLISLAAFWGYLAWTPAWRVRWGLRDFFRIDTRRCREIFVLGMPIGLQIVFEVSAFNVATLMMGWLPAGAIAIAAHSIAINYAALAFMVPLGISFAISIRTGQARGEGDLRRARAIGLGGIMASWGFMSIVALIFLLAREPLCRLILDPGTPDAPAVLALASHLLLFAAAFALFDGTQITALGALRGFRDVRTAAVLLLCVYWGFALPLGFVLGFSRDMAPALGSWLAAVVTAPWFPGLGWGASGVWTALVLALGVAAIALTCRFLLISRIPLVNTSATLNASRKV